MFAPADAPGASAPLPEHELAFRRLIRRLEHGNDFQLVFAEFTDERYRNRLVGAVDAALAGKGIAAGRLEMTPDRFGDFAEFEQALRAAAAGGGRRVLHVLGGDGWFSLERWLDFNVRREAVAQGARARLVFWLTAAQIETVARNAPDLWAWRSSVIAFDTAPELPLREAAFASSTPVDDAVMRSKRNRIDEIRAALAQPGMDAETRAVLVGELRDLHALLGDGQEALEAAWEAVELRRALGNERGLAFAYSRLADILEMRGELDEAMRIRREQLLPVFTRLGDARELAFAHGQIADILEARGELDEALRIRQELELPVFTRLNDARSLAITHGKIADILQARGQLDEALRIRREQELPVFTRLGDMREIAFTYGKIAEIFHARGQLDEALRICREQQLPAYSRLGDARAIAVTQGQIADILQARGQLDEALRIRCEQELPVFTRVGDVRALAITHSKIAEILFAQDQPEEARAMLLRSLEGVRALGAKREIAAIAWNLASHDILEGKAEAVMPLIMEAWTALSELGIAEDIAVVGTTLGQLHLAQGRPDEARSVLTRALAAARQLERHDLVARIKSGLDALPPAA